MLFLSGPTHIFTKNGSAVIQVKDLVTGIIYSIPVTTTYKQTAVTFTTVFTGTQPGTPAILPITATTTSNIPVTYCYSDGSLAPNTLVFTAAGSQTFYYRVDGSTEGIRSKIITLTASQISSVIYSIQYRYFKGTIQALVVIKNGTVVDYYGEVFLKYKPTSLWLRIFSYDV